MENSPEYAAGNIAAVNDAVTVNSAPNGRATFVLSGVFVGTIQFEATLDGTTYFALSVTPLAGGAVVTSATAPGQWTVNAAMARMRLRASAWTSGTAVGNILAIL